MHVRAVVVTLSVLLQCCLLGESRAQFHGSDTKNVIGSKGSRKLAEDALYDKVDPVDCERFPYLAILQDSENNPVCGGVLINPRWVMTAAHCLAISKAGSTPTVVIGACGRDDKNETVERERTKNSIRHPKWNHDPGHGYDIALLELPKKSQYLHASLPDDNQTYVEGQILIALNSRRQANPSNSKAPPMTEMEFLSPGTCCNSIKDVMLWNHMICARPMGQSDVCDGDSGGPLLVVNAPDGNIAGGRPKLDFPAGIISFGLGECDNMKPSFFTNVQFFRGWIDCVLRNEDNKDECDDSFKLEKICKEPQCSRPEDEVAQDLVELASQPEKAMTSELVNKYLEECNIPDACCHKINGTADTGRTALHMTAFHDNRIVARALVENGANVNVKDIFGDTPLHFAARFNAFKVAEILIDNGAEVDAIGSDGRTPLYEATRFGSLSMMQMLIQKGADVNAKMDNGQTPLHALAVQNVVTSLNILLVSGARLDIRDNSGEVPLHEAAERAHFEVCELLVNAGADATIENNDGRTPGQVICNIACGGRNTDEAKTILLLRDGNSQICTTH